MSDREEKEEAELTKAEAAEADDLAELAESLRAAHDPKALSPKDHEEILSRVLPKAKNGGGGRVIRVTFGVVSAMALAAALILYLRPAGGPPGPTSEAPIAWARSRSTTPLFSEPWKRGEATARIDRIALAREHDFRENRFAARLAPPERTRGLTPERTRGSAR